MKVTRAFIILHIAVALAALPILGQAQVMPAQAGQVRTGQGRPVPLAARAGKLIKKLPSLTENTWCTQTLDIRGNTGRGVSINTYAFSQPNMAYYGDENAAPVLRWAAYDNLTWAFENVEPVDGELGDTALQPGVSNPAIAYQKSGKLRFARRVGSAWEMMFVDSTTGAGRHCSIGTDWRQSNAAYIGYDCPDAKGGWRVKCAVPTDATHWNIESVPTTETQIRQVRLTGTNAYYTGKQLVWLNGAGAVRLSSREAVLAPSWSAPQTLITSNTLAISDCVYNETQTSWSTSLLIALKPDGLKDPANAVRIELLQVIKGRVTRERIAEFTPAETTGASLALAIDANFGQNAVFVIRSNEQDVVYRMRRDSDTGNVWTKPAVVTALKAGRDEARLAVAATLDTTQASDVHIHLGIYDSFWGDLLYMTNGAAWRDVYAGRLDYGGADMALYGNTPYVLPSPGSSGYMYLQEWKGSATFDADEITPPPSSTYYQGEAVQIDRAGHPHVLGLCYSQGTDGQSGLVHAWRDNAGKWNVKMVAEATTLTTTARLFLDETDTTRVLPRIVTQESVYDGMVSYNLLLFSEGDDGAYKMDRLVMPKMAQGFDALQLRDGRIGVCFATLNYDLTTTLTVYYQEWRTGLGWLGKPEVLGVHSNINGIAITMPTGVDGKPALAYRYGESVPEVGMKFTTRYLYGGGGNWQSIAVPGEWEQPLFALERGAETRPHAIFLFNESVQMAQYAPDLKQWVVSPGPQPEFFGSTVLVKFMLTNRAHLLYQGYSEAHYATSSFTENGYPVEIDQARQAARQSPGLVAEYDSLLARAIPSLLLSKDIAKYLVYYKEHRDETLNLMHDETLLWDGYRMMENFYPGDKAYLDGRGDTVIVTQQAIDTATFFINRLSGVASPALTTTLQNEMTATHDLQDYVGETFEAGGRRLGFPERSWVRSFRHYQ